MSQVRQLSLFHGRVELKGDPQAHIHALQEYCPFFTLQHEQEVKEESCVACPSSLEGAGAR